MYCDWVFTCSLFGVEYPIPVLCRNYFLKKDITERIPVLLSDIFGEYGGNRNSTASVSAHWSIKITWNVDTFQSDKWAVSIRSSNDDENSGAADAVARHLTFLALSSADTMEEIKAALKLIGIHQWTKSMSLTEAVEKYNNTSAVEFIKHVVETWR